MAMSLEEQQKRQLAASLTVDLVKVKDDQLLTTGSVVEYFDRIFDAIYEKLSEKA